MAFSFQGRCCYAKMAERSETLKYLLVQCTIQYCKAIIYIRKTIASYCSNFRGTDKSKPHIVQRSIQTTRVFLINPPDQYVGSPAPTRFGLSCTCSLPRINPSLSYHHLTLGETLQNERGNEFRITYSSNEGERHPTSTPLTL